MCANTAFGHNPPFILNEEKNENPFVANENIKFFCLKKCCRKNEQSAFQETFFKNQPENGTQLLSNQNLGAYLCK